MPYAADNTLSQSPISGGVEITDAEYQAGIQAQLVGKRIAIRDGALRILDATTRTVYSTEDKPRLEIAENDDTPPGYTEIEPGEFDEWDGGQWVEDTSAALEDAKARAVQRVNDGYRKQVAPMIREYPIEEQQGWGKQDAESQAYLSWHDAGQQGDAPATPVLDRILAGRNGTDGTETLYDLCLAVRENAELFIQAQELTGRRQRLVKLAQAATTVEEAEAIEWS